MELRLAVRTASGAGKDVVAEVADDELTARLLEALARQVGLSAADARSALLERTGEWLDPLATVAEASLRDGDGLLLAGAQDGVTLGADAGHPHTATELHVVGGPAAGAIFPLPPGNHVVGRGPGADLVVRDGSLSRRHAAFEVDRDGITLRDAGSTNGTFVDGRPATNAHALRGGEVIEIGRSLLEIRSTEAARDELRTDGSGGIPFNRPPRVTRSVEAARVRLPAPPEESSAPRLPKAAIMIPPVLGAVMFLITRSPYMLMVAALSPAMALSSWTENRRSGRQRQTEGERQFREAVAEAVSGAAGIRASELERLRAAGPGPTELRACVVTRAATLWERRPDDPDFLDVRLGIADVRSALEIELDHGGSRALRAEALAELADGELLPSVPVILTLNRGYVGVAGPRAAVNGSARWLAIQAAVQHSPGELVIAAAIAPANLEQWDWLKWLPQTRPEWLAADEPAARELLEVLEQHSDPSNVLLFVDGELGLDRRALAPLVGSVSIVWLARDARELPGECTDVVVLDPNVARLRWVGVASGHAVADVAFDAVDESYARSLARLLAPIRDLAARESQSELPQRVSLLELLGIDTLTVAAIEERWQHGDERLSAAIGVAEEGPFEIEVGQNEGLRLLIGGMPGAGKSELLQALIAALAASHPPDAISFLLIDYKGGAAFRDAVQLPHTAGIITDLDAHLADRARVSLLAELRHREALLRDAGARSLRELRRRHPDGAPPHLLIIVDEFATLGREVPAFVETLVDVAQRGRSLGLHLVLATQRPRGAINDTIRANTNLRIAMRMSDAAESADVIEAPDAAGIAATLPGRALALAGRRADGTPRLVSFQAAYAGGHTHIVGHQGPGVRELRFGERGPRAERLLSAVGVQLTTDLQGIVEVARGAAEQLGLQQPASPWRAPLPDLVRFDGLPGAPPRTAMLGLIDEPGARRQGPLALDLERDGGAVVYGTSRSGKTSALRAVACSLAAGASPGEVQIYALDFASRALGDLEQLPHCGSVIAGDDEERVTRLIGSVRRAMTTRRERLAASGEPQLTGVPSIVLLLDGYAGFASAFDRVDQGELVQAVTRIAAEGRPLGVYLFVTADRRADVPGALAGVLPNRFVLRTADPDEGVALGLPRSARTSELPPGRGFTQDGLEFQTALITGEDLAAIASASVERHGRERAPRIGTLPRRLSREALPIGSTPLTAVLGTGGEDLRPVQVDLEQGNLLVAGAHHSGRSTTLASIATSLRRADPELQLHLLSVRASPIAELTLWTSVAVGSDACAQALDRLATSPGPMVVVVDDATDLPEGAGASALEALLERGRDELVRVVAAVEINAAQRAYGGWIRDLRNEQRGLVLQPNLEADGELLGTRLPRRSSVPLTPGRGYLIDRGMATLLQIAGD